MDLELRKQLAEAMTGREVRTFGMNDFELRESADGTLRFRGVASVTETAYDMGFYSERIRSGAFQRTLKANPDVQLLINHEGMPIGRTGRNMTLTETKRGLEVDAQLNPKLPRVDELRLTANDGLIDQMSFGFRVLDQSWDEDFENREITEVNIDRGDVSVVNQGANPATSFTMRDATEFLRGLSKDDFLALMRLIVPEEPTVPEPEPEPEVGRVMPPLDLYRARALALRVAGA